MHVCIMCICHVKVGGQFLGGDSLSAMTFGAFVPFFHPSHNLGTYGTVGAMIMQSLLWSQHCLEYQCWTNKLVN